MMFRWPGCETELGEPMNGEDAVTEFQEGLINNRNNGSGGNNGGVGSAQLDEERKRIFEEREKWEKEKTEMQTHRDEEGKVIVVVVN